MFNWKELQEVYLISDTHFWHKNITKYCNRPVNWHKITIENWNNTVSPSDKVLHLGDFSLGNRERTELIVSMLNGSIYLIKGNHDRHGRSWYKPMGINMISPFIIQEGGKSIYFTHKPVDGIGKDGIGIHGHWHQNSPWIREGPDGSKYMNVSVDQIHYKPRKFKDMYLLVEKGGLHFREELI